MVGRFVTSFVVAFIVFAAGSRASAEDVLVIGDSHSVGAFGSGLMGALRAQNGMRSSVAASCGSRPAHFLGTPYRNAICSWDVGYGEAATESSKHLKGGARPMPNLGALLIERKPDTVVIAHGTNELPIRPGYSHGKLPGRPPSLKEIESALMKAEGDATRTIRAVKKSGAKCVWIGPPSEPEEIYSIDLQDKFTRMYAEACRAAGCKFLDSRTVTKATDTKKDTAMGVHYYGAAGTAWGRDIAVQVIQEIRPTPPSEAKNQKSDGVSGVQAK